VTQASHPSGKPLSAAAAAWLDPEQLHDWMALSMMLEVLPAALDAQLKRSAGINLFEYNILAGLSDSPGRTIGMSRLALLTSGSLSRLSHAIGRLERREWVRRVPTGTGRAVDVTLTDAGAAALVQIAPGHVAEVRRLVVDPLGAKQLSRLGRHARTLLDALDPGYGPVLDEFAALTAGPR